MPRVPTYVAFLRAINLGATRKFPKDAIKAATEAAGGRDVETYINTGNVRLTHSARSVATVQAALEKAYAAEAGFEVPTIVFTTGDLAAPTARARQPARRARPGRPRTTSPSTRPRRRPATAEAAPSLEHAGRPSWSTAAPRTSSSTAAVHT